VITSKLVFSGSGRRSEGRAENQKMRHVVPYGTVRKKRSGFLEGLLRVLDGLSHHLSDALVSQVDIDLEPLESRISEFNSDDHQGVRLDISRRVLSDLWREQSPVQHLHISARVPGCVVEGGSLELYHLSKKVRLTLHLISSVVRFTFQPTLEASLQRKAPLRHQTSQTALELIKKNQLGTPSTTDVQSNCMVHPSKSKMKSSPNSNMT
jgi:hypothetical protein